MGSSETGAGLNWPATLGGWEVSEYRALSETCALGLGPKAVFYVLYPSRPLAQDVRAHFARRVREMERVLGSQGHPHVLRPVGHGLEGRFVWMAAESPGPGARPWPVDASPGYPAFESLASALAFLHNRKYCHGAVSPEALFVREDGRSALAPWPPTLKSAADANRSATVEQYVVSAAGDVLQACDLFPAGDPAYAEVAELCREQVSNTRLRRKLGPASGGTLLVRLQTTEHGKKLACGSDSTLGEDLGRLAQAWFEWPSFVDPCASPGGEDGPSPKTTWQAFLEALHFGEGEVVLTGEQGCGKSRWLEEASWRLEDCGVAVGLGPEQARPDRSRGYESGGKTRNASF